MDRMRRRAWSGLIGLALLSSSLAAAAESRRKEVAVASDRYQLDLRSDTYLELYRRALLPGPLGALVVSQTVAPLYEYVSLSARKLDLPSAPDSLDLELSAWGRAELVSDDDLRRIDGDLRVANLRFQRGGLYVKLGRQAFVGGAARFARFDGVAMGQRFESGFGMDAYVGSSVQQLARRRQTYGLLGSVSDSLVKNPEVLGDRAGQGSWLGGARLYFDQPQQRWGAAVSFHEQREGAALSHRNLALEASLTPSGRAMLAGNTVLDLDSSKLADARVFADYELDPKLSLGAEYLHTVPSLFLSRQSVLSVFSTADFDEVGTSASYRVVREIEVGGSAFIDLYSGEDVGGRVELRAGLRPEGTDRLLVFLAASRVRTATAGYRALRASLRRRVVGPLTATAETYLYFYDRPIVSYDTSSVYAGTLEYQVASALNLLWGASVARSPYAELDAQTMVRASYVWGKSH